MKKEKLCTQCRVPLIMRHKMKFCSNRCQVDFQHIVWVRAWKDQKIGGNRGVNTRNLSKHLKRYLTEKYNNRCCLCGWNKLHPDIDVVPLEVDHIDGNAENNSESNLRLLCPNCHALTPFYKNLNRGNGRKWRMKKYIKSSNIIVSNQSNA